MFARAFFQGSYWFPSCTWVFRHVHEIESPLCQREYLSPRTKHAATAAKLFRKFGMKPTTKMISSPMKNLKATLRRATRFLDFGLLQNTPPSELDTRIRGQRKKGEGYPFGQTPPSRSPSFNIFIPPLPSVRIESVTLRGYMDMQSRQDYTLVFFGLRFHFPVKCLWNTFYYYSSINFE